MKIAVLEKNQINDVINLWNETLVDKSIYKALTKEIFETKFLKTKNSHNLVLTIKEKIIGFGNSVYINDEKTSPGFVTCVVIKDKFQRLGYGTKLLKELEQYLVNNNKTYIRQLFLNPILLEWYIPNTKHDHPGAPGVEFDSVWLAFLLKNGYVQANTHLDAYYLNITNYERPEEVVKKNKTNEEKGYYIKVYDSTKHFGFDELFQALRNPGWHQTVKNNLSKDNPDPMLVVVKDNEILGWTGPMHTTETKRGYFGGIGIHPKTQGLGLGTSLFSELIYQSKLNGAHFMSLFTGSENPARNIYLKAGFNIVKSFAILRKDL